MLKAIELDVSQNETSDSKLDRLELARIDHIRFAGREYIILKPKRNNLHDLDYTDALNDLPASQ